MKNVKNLLFDFGNVLFDIEMPRIEIELKKLFGSQFPAAKNLLEKENLYETLEVGGISADEFLEKISLAASPPLEIEAVRAAFNSIFIEMPARRFEMMLSLRQRFGVFMLSNINAVHSDFIDDYLLKTHGFADWRSRFFDGVYYSNLIRLRKPTAEAFEYVCADAEILPEQTLFIDDLPENIEAARRLGFQTRLHPVRSEIVDWMRDFLS